MGWQNGHDEAKIDYACSLLRENAGVWIIPYVGQPDEAPWHTWVDFMTELQRQFGPVDPVGEARVKLKELYQGTSSMTAYWNDFRLIATEADLDQTTAGEWLLAGMKPKLQEAWGNESAPFTTTERLANWAIEKETKLAMVKHVQSARKNETPRKNDGTFKPRTTTQGGDAMDLDATRRRPQLNLSNNEYKRRRDNNLCLRCAKRGHRMRECRSPRNNSEGGIQSRQHTPAKPAWQRRNTIREIRLDSDEEGSVKDEGPQQ